MLNLARAARACQCASTSTAAACRHAVAPSGRPISSKAAVRSPEAAPSTSPRDDPFDYTAPLWYQEEDGTRWFSPLPGKQRQRDWRGWIRESRVGSHLPASNTASDSPGPWSSPPPPPPIAVASPLLQNEREQQRRALERYISLPHSAAATPSKSTRRRSDLTRMRRTARTLGLKVVESQLAAEVEPGVESINLDDIDLRSYLASVTAVPSTESTAALSAEQLRKVWEAFVAPPTTSPPLRPADFECKDDFQLALSLLAFLSSQADESRLPLALDVLRSLISSEAIASSDVASPPYYATKTQAELPQEIILRTVLLRTVVPLALGDGNVELAARACEELVALRLSHEATQEAVHNSAERMLVQRTIDQALELHRQQRTVTYRSHTPRTLLDSAHSATDQQQGARLERIHTLLSLLRHLDLSSSSSTSLTHPSRLAAALSQFAREAVALRRWDLLSSIHLAYSPLGFSLASVRARYARGLAKYYSGDLYLGGASGTHKGLIRKREWDALVQGVGREIRHGAVGWGEEDRAAWLEVVLRSRLHDAGSAREAVELYEKWGGVVLPARTVLELARGLLKLGKGVEFGQQLARDYIARLTSPSSPYRSQTSSVARSSVRQRRTTIPHYDLSALASLYTLLGDQRSVVQVYSKMLELKILPDERDIDEILRGVWEMSTAPNEITALRGGEQSDAPEEVAGGIEGRRTPSTTDVKLEHALKIIEMAFRIGITITQFHFASILRRMVASQHRDKAQVQRQRVSKVIALATRMGLPATATAELARMVKLLPRGAVSRREMKERPLQGSPTPEELDSLLVNRKSGQFSPALLYLHLASWLSPHDGYWKSAHALYQRAVQAHGFQDDRSIALVLRFLLGPFSPNHRADKKERARVKIALREVVEALVNPPCASPSPTLDRALSPFDPPLSPVTSQTTADLVYRGLLKLDDPEAVGKVVKRLGEVEPSAEMKQTVKRWLRGQKGGRGVVVGWLAQ